MKALHVYFTKKKLETVAINKAILNLKPVSLLFAYRGLNWLCSVECPHLSAGVFFSYEDIEHNNYKLYSLIIIFFFMLLTIIVFK